MSRYMVYQSTVTLDYLTFARPKDNFIKIFTNRSQAYLGFKDESAKTCLLSKFQIT